MKKLSPLVVAPSTASFVAATVNDDNNDVDVDVVKVTQIDANCDDVIGDEDAEKTAALTSADRRADASSTQTPMTEREQRHCQRPPSPYGASSCLFHHSAVNTVIAATATRWCRTAAYPPLLPAFSVTRMLMTTIFLMMVLLRDGSGGVAEAESAIVDHLVMMPSMWNHHTPNYRQLHGVEAVHGRHSTSASLQKRKRHTVGGETARKQRYVSPVKMASEQLGDDYERMLVEALQRDELRFEHSAHRQLSKSAPCRELVDRNATVLRTMARSTKRIETLRSGVRFPIAYCAAAAARIAPPLLAVAASSLDGVRATAADEGQCAVASKCATIYKWKKAEVETRRPAAEMRQHRPLLSLDVARKTALIDELADGVNDIRLLEAAAAADVDNADEADEVSVRVDDVLVPSGCTCVINALSTGFSDLPIIIF